MNREDRLLEMRSKTSKNFGPMYVNLGKSHYHLSTYPSPSIMWDYKSGIGGVPRGHGIEFYGANKIGKSSIFAYGTLAEVAAAGDVGLLVAVEPRLVTPEDKEWALALGLNPDDIAIQYPDDVQQTFEMLRDAVFDDKPERRPDYIVVDSIGGMGNVSSAKIGGKDKAYGVSGAVTAGLNDIMPRLYKNNQGLMLLNQQRQAPSPASNPGMRLFESPGGEGLKHHMRIRCHVKPGGERITSTIDGDKVVVGQEIACVFRKNNMSQSAEKTAKFTFYNIDTEEYGLGVDKIQDIINVGKLTGVLQGGGWIEHHTFPGKGKLNGKAAVREFLDENPKAGDVIRDEVMAVMIDRELRDGVANRQRAEKAVSDG